MTPRDECSYTNCVATAERDWLLAEASDEVREYFFAIRAAEAARLLALTPIVVALIPAVVVSAGD